MTRTPVPTAETRTFWEGCAKEQLLYQRCPDCDAVQFYPRSRCCRCHADKLDWQASSGYGVVHSYTVVHKAADPAFAEDTPYILALLDMEEGFRMMTNLLVADSATVRIGDAVKVVFRGRDDFTIPQAVPDEDRC